MFRILVLQMLYTLSDNRTEYRNRDRLVDPLRGSAMGLLSLTLHEAVPDTKTIWQHREQLTRAGTLTRAFYRFDTMLREPGYLAMGGQIVECHGDWSGRRAGRTQTAAECR